MTINASSGEITSIESSTPRKLKRPGKLELIRFA